MPKQKKLFFVLTLFFLAVFWSLFFIHQNYVAPIIMYHSVNPQALPENRLAVKSETFERQMNFLKRNRYNVLSLEKLVDLIRDKKKLPPRTIAITFDDGYIDNYTYAFAILKKYNLPATIFIIVNEVDRRNQLGLRDRLNWQEIKTMQDSGLIAFGSHALGPDPLIKIKSREELKRQIFDSRQILEEKLGKKVNLFSYPEGMFDAKIRQLVIEAGYLGAVATNPGPDYSDDDTFALKRIRISENASNMFIFAIETSGYYTFMKEFKKRGKK